MRYSPINDGYIIKEDEYEDLKAMLDKLELRLMALDSVGESMVNDIQAILKTNEDMKLKELKGS